MASSNDCLSPLNNRRSGIRPHAVKKRTPQVPVAYSSDKDNNRKYISPARQGLKLSGDTKNDAVAHEIALALAEASHRGDSPLVSWKSKRKAKGTPPTVRNGEMMCAGSELTTTKRRASEMDGSGYILSLGSTEPDNEYFDRDKKYAMGREGTGTLDFQRRGKRYSVKKQKVESKSIILKTLKKLVAEQRKDRNKVLSRENLKLKLRKVQDPSIRNKETKVKKLWLQKASAYVREEDFYITNDSKTKRNCSIPGVEHTALKTSKPGRLKEGGHQSNTGLQKRKQLLPFKVYNDAQTDCHWSDNQKIQARVEVNKSMNKGKQSSHYITHPKQGKLVNPPRNASSSAELDMQKSSIEKDRKSTESIVDEQPDKLVPSFRNRELNIKERPSNCLSWYQVRRWCAFEWFYSAIDYPWFAKREFVEYLNHVGLGHVPRLTRVEWGVIRRPWRFSEQFLKQEKEKLNQYRESVRTHYAELNASTREGLPTDLTRPLSVGQHVIAFHPRTREIHNGIVLTVDHNRCRVQFDQSELGVEHIMDIDCMPLNPVENLPASFTKHNVNVNKYIENLKELKINEHLKEGKAEGYEVASSDHVESAVPYYIQPSTHHINKSSKQTQGKSSNFVQAKGGPGETATVEGANSQPSIPARIQAKEADIRAIFELTRALYKKDAMVSELRRMNDEVLENQNGDNFIRDSESFKKEYAAVLLQLSQVNDQVSSALFCLRQCNTYRVSPTVSLVKPMENLRDPGGHSSSSGYSCYAQESAGHVCDIVESSRAKARKMVDAAMQDQSTACASKLEATSSAPDPKSNSLSNRNEEKTLTDLIVNCVAAFLMIQTCTARQFPPAEVAQVLDEALTSLQPFCPQNLSVYGEIQRCMSIVRNQTLALVPA